MENRNHKPFKKPRATWDTRRKIVSIVAAFMVLLFLVPLIADIFVYAGAVTLDDIQQMRSQQSQLEEKKKNLQGQLNGLKEKENSAMDECLLYEQQLEVINEQIGTTNDMIDQYSEQIEQTKVELADAEEHQAAYYDLFCERVRSMEENGSATYWQILFSAGSFSDLLDRISFVSDVMNYDNNVMAVMEDAKQAVKDKQSELEEKQAGYEESLAALEDQQAQANEASEAAERALDEIRSNQDAYADQLDEIERLSESLEEDIVRSEAEYQAQLEELRRQAEEAERKRREEEELRRQEEERQRQEEEERRRQEEEERQRQEQENQNNEEDPDDNSEEEPAPDPKPEPKPDLPPVSGVSGAEVANYACQFIGNPYVWGGTSLTGGADCSGFVMSVYSHFGISLPHSSIAMRGCGSGVAYGDAKPGDLILYMTGSNSGHVGIYIGGGRMVNALNAKSGIVISNVNTGRSGFCVRRIVA